MRLHQLSIIIGAGLILSACASITNQHQSFDHKAIYEIDCSSLTSKIQYCHDKAKSLCPRGYKVLRHRAMTKSQKMASSPFPLSNFISQSISDSIIDNTPGARKGLTIKCL